MIRTLVVERTFPGKIKDVFVDLAEDPEFFPRYFKGFAPFVPGILKITPAWKGKAKAGVIRTVALSDGTSVDERITLHEPPRLHRYEMARMNTLQKLVCQKMHAEFTLREAGKAQTDVRWTYWIESTNPLHYPLIAFLSWAFHKAMTKFMDSVMQAKAG